VIIVKHKVYDGDGADVIQEVSEFMGNHKFRRTETLNNDSGTLYLDIEYHRYFPAQNINAENYDLIRMINEGAGDVLVWQDIKDNYKAFIKNVFTGGYNDDNTWSTGLFPMESVNSDEYREPIDIPLIGISVSLIYQRSCAKYPAICEAKKGTVD